MRVSLLGFWRFFLKVPWVGLYYVILAVPGCSVRYFNQERWISLLIIALFTAYLALLLCLFLYVPGFNCGLLLCDLMVILWISVLFFSLRKRKLVD